MSQLFSHDKYVELITHYPHKIKVEKLLFRYLVWLEDNMGIRANLRKINTVEKDHFRWIYAGGHLHFKDEADAVLFKLNHF